MLKPLTAEGRFECGLDTAFLGKIWAFVPVVGENFGARLGVAVANENGYSPVPEHWCNADTWQEMSDHADELNAAMGLDPMTAVNIVASTMTGPRYAPAEVTV